MGLTYFKRYRMEIDLVGPASFDCQLPAEYRLVPWDASMVSVHGDVKFECFCLEMDAIVFPCLGSRDGCHRLMREIANREGFVPEATWLLEHCTGSGRGAGLARCCAGWWVALSASATTAPFRSAPC